MNPDSNTVISLSNVHFSVPQMHILKGITAEIRKSDSLFLTGKSGSGKSCLLKIIACLQNPTTGDVITKGISLRSATQAQLMELHINDGFVFQDNALISNLTVYDNLALQMRYQKTHSENEIREKIQSSLDNLGLRHIMNSRTASLSLGEQKLLSITRAVQNKPDLVFFDEPLASLDTQSAQKVTDIIKGLAENGVTLVIISHEPEFILQFASRLWVIESGNLSKDIPIPKNMHMSALRELSGTF